VRQQPPFDGVGTGTGLTAGDLVIIVGAATGLGTAGLDGKMVISSVFQFDSCQLMSNSK